MVKNFSRIATAVALTVAIAAPMLASANTMNGYDISEKMRMSQEIMKQNKGNKMMETKEKHDAKVAQSAAVKACVAPQLKTRNTALNDAWKAYLAATKEARTAYNTALKAARDAYAASTKDAAARETYKAARAKALADRKAARNAAWETLKTARTAARDAYKAAVATCKTAQ